MSIASGGPEYRIKRSPNFDNLRRTLLRLGPPGPVPIIELYADPGMVQMVVGEEMTWNPWAARRARTSDSD